MTRAFSVRLDPELLTEAKKAAMTAGESFTAYVAGALRLRMTGTILEETMVPLQATGDVARGTVEILRGGTIGAPERKTRPDKGFLVDPAECQHPWRRPTGLCISCGHQR